MLGCYGIWAWADLKLFASERAPAAKGDGA